MTVGVDVSKQRLDVFELTSGEAYSIPNTLESMEQWLDRFQRPIQVAIEPTNSYHELLTQQLMRVDTRYIWSTRIVWRTIGRVSDSA